ncbi:hypothetical protein RAS12_29885 [Achromobacter seleniivolatilans]|uniref:DUF2066 domain-containing protein n=1 Tax=Achromobacter seleniivolatilans TaxID=3047478 RepID=A0ABY9M2C0_9BURK|nr:hypothetical protein [Achromobacter sp. R39]WMD20748.1 hypothetical protein RAS12_29885 [Achromobacter sp. R39]
MPWLNRPQLARRKLLACLALLAALPASVAQVSPAEPIRPPSLVWGALPDGDLYLLVASPRLSKPEVVQLADGTIGPGVGDDRFVTQVWSNVPAPIQLWVTIDPARLRDAGLTLDQALKALDQKLGVSAQPLQGIGIAASWFYPKASRTALSERSDTSLKLPDGRVADPAMWTEVAYRQYPEPWNDWQQVALSLTIHAESDRSSLHDVVIGRLNQLAQKLPADVSILMIPGGPRLKEVDGIFVTLGAEHR